MRDESFNSAHNANHLWRVNMAAAKKQEKEDPKKEELTEQDALRLADQGFKCVQVLENVSQDRDDKFQHHKARNEMIDFLREELKALFELRKEQAKK